MPTEGHVGDADLARIDLAVFTPDAWVGGLGAPFFGALLRAPNARWLHMFAAGTDNPVFAQLLRQGVRLTNSAGSSATPIAHTVIMHTIAVVFRGAARLTATYAATLAGWLGEQIGDV